MPTLPVARDIKLEKLGMPAWAWPVLGLTGGLALVFLVHGTCFVDPSCK